MIRYIFYSLFFVTLIFGAFAYFAPSQKPFNPLGLLIKDTGFESAVDRNNTQYQQVSNNSDKSLYQIRKKMDDLALEQDKIFDTLQDQQRTLNDTGRTAADIMQEALQQGKDGDTNILELKSLTTQMQGQQNLVVAHGQELLTLNDQITNNRRWIADQIDFGNINSETSKGSFYQRYLYLKNLSSEFLNKLDRHNQEVHDQMDRIKDQLQALNNNAAYNRALQEQSSKERIQRLLDKEREDMLKLADNEEKNRELLRDAEQKIRDTQEHLRDQQQQSEDFIRDQREQEKDQELIIKQRIADEEQRLQDQENK